MLSVKCRDRGALVIAAIYAAFGALWILFSDQILHFLVSDPEVELHLQTVKGWGYVLITAVLVYVLANQHGRRLDEARVRAQESADLFRLAFETIPDMIAIIRLSDHRLATVNSGFSNLTGHEAANVPGRTLDDLDLWVDGEERAQFLALIDREAELTNVDLRLKSKAGQTVLCVASTRTVTLGGHRHAVLVVHDVTAAREIERERRSWIDQLEAVIGERTRALREEIAERQAMQGALFQANEQLEDRVRIRTQELERQIAERMRIEKELVAAKEQAELANRAKTVFLATMSHELRTPLNSIIGFTDLIGRQILGPIGIPKYLEYIKDVNDAGRLLLELINDILDISRVEIDAVHLNESELDISRLLRSCARMAADKVREPSLQTEVDVAKDFPGLRGDERRVRQIVLNLLSNARKFTPAGGSIRAAAALDEEGCIAITVADTGIGIAAHDLDRVMSMFGQAEDHLSRRYQGAGLGLPLSRKLAELHGATLTLQSELGKGTVVTVRFPAERTIRHPG